MCSEFNQPVYLAHKKNSFVHFVITAYKYFDLDFRRTVSIAK